MNLDVSTAFRAQGTMIPFETVVDASGASRDDITFAQACVTGQAAALGNRIAIIGEINLVGQACCARCTKLFDFQFDTPYEAVYARTGEEGTCDDDAGEDPDVEFFEGSKIDLTSSVTSTIALSMPMRFLCSQDCKGLCLTCGRDLNEDACSCIAIQGDSPFAKLKTLLTQEKEVDPDGSTEG